MYAHQSGLGKEEGSAGRRSGEDFCFGKVMSSIKPDPTGRALGLAGSQWECGMRQVVGGLGRDSLICSANQQE